MIRLIKCSYPGWATYFETKEDAEIELDKYICSACEQDYCCGRNLEDMLATPCGLEFMVEDDIDDPPTDTEVIQDKFDKKESKPEWTDLWT